MLEYQYLIIGNGKMAKHFCHYLDLIKVPYANYHYTQPREVLSRLLQQATHVLLLIKDSAIDPFIKEYLATGNTHYTLVHFSGCFRSGYAYGAHPLMTFATSLYTLDDYLEIPFICEKSDREFAELLPGLPNKFAYINPGQKAYYHALCVCANNFTTILWQMVAQRMHDKLGIDNTLLKPILQQTMTNLVNNPDKALTGPFIRKDMPTIQQNLSALSQDELQIIYQAFVDIFFSNSDLA